MVIPVGMCMSATFIKTSPVATTVQCVAERQAQYGTQPNRIDKELSPCQRLRAA